MVQILYARKGEGGAIKEKNGSKIRSWKGYEGENNKTKFSWTLITGTDSWHVREQILTVEWKWNEIEEFLSN